MDVHVFAAGAARVRSMAVAVTFLVCTGLAQAQVPNLPGLSPLYFKQNTNCSTWPNCQIPASATFPNPNAYTKLVSLTVPPGNYLVTSKLSAFAAGGTSYVNFECALLDANDAPLDYSSFDGTAEQTLFLQSPLSITVSGGHAVHIGCRAYGFLPNYTGLVDMHVWNVNLAAQRVGPLYLQ